MISFFIIVLSTVFASGAPADDHDQRIAAATGLRRAAAASDPALLASSRDIQEHAALQDAGGCPVAFDGNAHYDAGDLVSKDGVIYQCKHDVHLSRRCSQDGYEPGSNLAVWWRQAWDVVGSCTGTIAPTGSPIYTTSSLDVLGGCPREWEDGRVYKEGARVSKHNVVFQCKAIPLSAHCGQAGYAPLELGAWRDAWAVEGYCDGSISPTESPNFDPSSNLGPCPGEWSAGDNAGYDEGDQVSVIVSDYPSRQVVFQCKPWPLSGYCGQYSPTDEPGGYLGWNLIGPCAVTTPSTASSIESTSTDAQKQLSPEISYLLQTIPTLDPILSEYETPLSIRYAGYFSSSWWSCVAAYSSTFNDTLTKERPVVFSPDTSTHNSAHRAACVVQATASLNDLWFGGNDAYLQAMKGLNLSNEIDPRMDSTVKACVDSIPCLSAVAAERNHTPQVMGHIIAQQTYMYGTKDGFNELGTDDGCVVSCRQFSDTTGYAPSNEPGRWQPLKESNGRGFFYFQEFVTPHIGKTAAFRYLAESERERVVREPNYSLTMEAEIREVIGQMSLLDDYSKVEIEAFDDKLYVANAVIGAFVNKVLAAGQDGFVDEELSPEGYTLSFERLLHFLQGFTAAELDGIIIAWREKVRLDLIRPTSLIKAMGDEMITTWAPGGVQEFAAKGFEAYIRVMPHAEYTSGSSCLLKTLEDYVKTYLTRLGLDTSFPVSFPPVVQGASKVEPGVVPSSVVELKYGSLEEMTAAGSRSRWNGGMHFWDSIPAGIELCSGIGDIVAQGSYALIRNPV